MRPVLRYHGGKWMLRHWIVGHFPAHTIYTESYGGAGSPLLAKRRAAGEVYNDLDGDIVRFFRTLRNPEKARALAEALWLTPFAREEYEVARVAKLDQVADDVEAARLLVIRSFQGQ
ncbi:MAG TPA: DNA adenine methylase, partial [Rubrobacter sp.]|nr:DNA adenine methylase [Rubrobacter sp.]